MACIYLGYRLVLKVAVGVVSIWWRVLGELDAIDYEEIQGLPVLAWEYLSLF